MRLILFSYLVLSAGSAHATTTGAVTEGVALTGPVNTTSINPSANTGQSSQSSGAGANAAAAAMLMAACMATQPPNIALCMMGALAAMQAGEDSGDAAQSGNAATASTVGTGLTSGTSALPIYAAKGSGSGGFVNPTVAAGMTALNDAGYSVTPTTVTSPDGSTSSTSSFSASQMQGVTPDQIKDANKTLAQVNADTASKYGVSSLATDGGGGVGSANDGGNSTDRIKLPNFKNPFALSADAQRKLIAGKTVLYDGEPIGTKGGNIFDMIHEAYDKEKAARSFIEGDSDVVSVRAPASTHILFPPLKKK